MLPNRKPDVIILDMDETILDHGNILKKAFDAAYANVTPQQRQSLSVQLTALDERIHNARQKWSDLRSWAYEHHVPLRPLLKKLPLLFDEAVMLSANPDLYPGVKEFLQESAKQGIARHLVTRADPIWTQMTIDRHDLNSLFSSIQSLKNHPDYIEKQQFYRDIIQVETERLGRPPIVWIVGDVAGDYPDSAFAKANFQGAEISLIAVTPTSQAYHWLSYSQPNPYVIGTYDSAREYMATFPA